MESVCNKYRQLYENTKGTTPHCVKTVAVLNSLGKIRKWGCHMVHHALYQKQNYSYAGVIEALSGAPFDVRFISFDEIVESPDILCDIDVIINIGDTDTVHTEIILFWRVQRVKLILVKERRRSLPMKEPRSWYKGIKRFRWL